ncbi:M15 family metallopeptidase [Marinilactibacillus sp. 15R]|uniref:M15 family metallopeptidase n=1 Tax=Marinilactibacillus sp. 15R TaxID=1911586 RepID=UPI0009F8BB5F|nr:M15 family metallopeptidase [Marinilactibacillus sp. 15R]
MMIKRRLILLLSSLILTGCSAIDNEKRINEQVSETTATDQEDSESTNSNQSKEETDSVTEEEKNHLALIESLPENVSTEDWNLILVNNWNPLPDDFEPDLVEVEPDKQIDRRIVNAYENWTAAAESAGHNLYLASGYRSVERQQNNFDYRVDQYMQKGDSKEEAIKKTEEYIAIPKSSEHHTGLAVDLIDERWIAEGNEFTPDYAAPDLQLKWLIDTMGDYGFILRYPEDKKEVTDINYESWHFRYVGEENARFIIDHNLALEEYIELLTERETRLDE